MSTPKPTIAIAGAGDLAKYLVEELLHADTHNIVVLSRASRPWFENRPGVTLHVTDYSKDSILSILNTTNAAVLFSFLHSNDAEFYVGVHERMLRACRESTACKRFVPSEYGGDIDTPKFAALPRFYEGTHGKFREVLEGMGAWEEEEGGKEGVEWTLVNGGWFMDYFVNGVGGTKSYMKALPGVWPIDLEAWTAVVLGSGEEKIGWTAARDVAKALVALLRVEKGGWEKHTYVVGEIGTWNGGMEKLEAFHGRRLTVCVVLLVSSSLRLMFA
jgi:nucleoside-diphosphate-sugar epimerase